MIQLKSKGHHAVTLLVGCALAIFLFGKGTTAYRESLAHAKESQIGDRWFESIVKNSSAGSPIVLVLSNSTGRNTARRALRIDYILSQYYGRDNLYYYIVPPRPTMARSGSHLSQSDMKRHAQKIRMVDQMADDKLPEVVVIADPGVLELKYRRVAFVLDAWLREQQFDWFDPQRYRREEHPHGHVSYFLMK